jgi:RHS repeat-associated protein
MGNLTTVTNALGHVTAFANYDANGRPRKITDPNGVVTTLAYNFRGQITSRVTLSQTTTYTYDKAGQLTKIQEPSGVVLNYGHDGAHRLTSISDRFGNRIVYTLDAAGDRIKEEAFDPSGTLARTHRRAYDGFERLSQDIGATSQTATFSYDANDNVVSAKDPNNNTTAFAYDALNRLTQKTEPQGSALTRYAYDSLGRLASVTDPRNLVTSYANNWLDLPTTVTSPDTRVTMNTYDAAGNVLTSRDARGQTTTYLYDDLNRRVKATHADGSIFTFVYDQGANGKGRLTSLTDTTGTTSWTYDAFGHVLQKKQVAGAVTLTTGWAYDAATGRLTSATYPSGYKALYSYDAGARVTAIGLQPPGGTAAGFIDQIAYSAFGPVVSWRQAASNKYYRRSFDRDGRISNITFSTGLVLTYAYDAGSRISSITESGRPAKTFSYDRNDRLTAYYFGESSIGYAYDLSGNRTDNNGQFHTIEASSNRLTAMTATVDRPARQLTYDAVGGTTNDGGSLTLAYDARNRLMRTTVGALATSHSVNGLGQRVAKNGPAGQVEYFYDLSGRLLGSYGAAAAVREEIVWLGDLPVGTIQGGAAYSIAPDHLGAPRQIVNSANGQVWYWDHHPFGETRSITAAAGFRHELRFPGQVYDSETGLHNNGFRDYWPFIGRYIESDPIGIAGGVGTYTYAGNDPVNAIDPLGLDPKVRSDALSDIPVGGQQYAQAAMTWCVAGPAGCGAGVVVTTGQLAAGSLAVAAGVAAAQTDANRGAARVHGNSSQSQEPTEVYYLINRSSGAIDKIGITNNPSGRYPQTYLDSENVDYVPQTQYLSRYPAMVDENIRLVWYRIEHGSRPRLNLLDR